jgi:hypothetical protein
MGPAAGIASRFRKSPVGFSRWKMIVWSSGVSMPSIDLSALAGLERPPASL